MTKKDYIKLAEVFRVHIQDENITAEQIAITRSIMTNIMNVLKNDNPMFDKDRFLSAVLKD